MSTRDWALPSGTTVAEAGEHAIIEWIRRIAPPPPPEVLTGIGDDAAVLDRVRNQVTVVTSDGLVEDVHFRRAWSAPADVGAKALVVNLSDLAAMGATPRTALLSLALPATLAMEALHDLMGGFMEVARANRMGLIGGNVSRSPGPLFVDVTVIGAAKARRLLHRHGARVGDALYVTGTLGGAAAGLLWLQRHAVERGHDGAGGGPRPQPRPGAPGPSGRDFRPSGVESPLRPPGAWSGPWVEPAPDVPPAVAAAIVRYRRPQARSRVGQAVGRARAASASIDLSDGLADALRQLAAASGLGIHLEAEAVPVDAGARQVATEAGMDPLALALSGGEDYELLFAVSRRATRRFLATVAQVGRVRVTRIGRVVAPPTLEVVRDGRIEPLPGGFQHFGP